ncbi:MAG: replicative DNA helicase [Pseudomonadota bacterium]|uniref:replicative DNA helicase n=1 Tax=Thermithiobacillus tepidarius TaxID=929 RepID=UPI000425409E|nr:replicative DNA helicase [Thermithiobacillus tepidarius]
MDADYPSEVSLKLPPHALEAEQAVLGSVLLDNNAWDRVADLLQEADFYRKEHRLIFAGMQRMLADGHPVDVLTLSQWLEANGELDEVGGLVYLATLANETPTAANVQAYARIVRERAVARSLIRVGNQIAELAYEPEGRPANALVDEAERLVFEISEAQARGQGGFRSLNSLLTEVVDHIETMSRENRKITGVPTGFVDLDERTSGLQNSDLIIIAGRPSMGKTSFAMNIAEHVAVVEKLPVAVFSMEMPGSQITLRLLSSRGRIDQHKVRTGQLGVDDWPRLAHTMGELSEAPLFVEDTPALSPTELRSRARRLKREHGLSLIVVDYLQLMQVPGRSENRTAEISEISRGLKALAKELNVPVIALSQLNRGLEQRTDKRPVMADLRESGAIEQDADLIMFIYRDEVYHKDQEDNKGIAEIIIGKHRNGPTGVVRMTFLGEYTRFENYAGPGYDSAYG